MRVVLHFKLNLIVLPRELVALIKPCVHLIQFKSDVFKDLMGLAYGPPYKTHHPLHLFADLNNAPMCN